MQPCSRNGRSSMEAYSPELTSPPVPLVALCGKQELLHPIADYLRTQHVPRVHSIGIEDAHSAAGAFGVRKTAGSPAGPPAGILKAGWLRRHRTQRPAAAAVLVERDAVVGDPSAWAWLVSQLDAIKAAVKSRGARIVVVVTVPPGAPEVPEDRMAMLCRQAGTDRRCVVTFCPAEGLSGLQVVGRVLYDQAVAFYAADAQRRLAHHAHRNLPSLELNLRTAFKLGALAEFRADWATALRMYSEAYSYVPQLLAATGASQPQRFAEIRAVAEHVHVKAVSLLLLALKEVPGAVAQFEMHLRVFRRLPFQAQPGLLASHHAWLCRQHMVMAELLVSCSADTSNLKREQQPGQLYLSAARAAIERRKVAAFIAGMHGGKPPAPPVQVEPGPYVGQLALLPAGTAAAALAAGGAAVTAALAGLPVSSAAVAAGLARRLTDEQFETSLQAGECGVEHSKATVDLLRTAADALRRSGRRTANMLQHCTLLLGDELLEAGEAAEAERLLAEVAGFYRRERWEGPLASALLLLRECRQQSHDLQAHTELSLEASALAGGPLDAHQRAAMATAAASVLVLEPPLLPELGDTGGDGGWPAAGAQQQLQASQGGQGGQGMHYSVASPHSGWLTVLPLCAGFFDPLGAGQQASCSVGSSAGAGAAGSGARPVPAVRFGAAFWSNAPIDLPLAAAEVHLSDALGSFTAALSAADANSGPAAPGAANAPADLVLPPTAWLRLAAFIPVRCSGELSASSIVLRFGDPAAAGGGSSITFRLPALLPQAAQHPAAPASPRRASQAIAAGPGGQAPAHAVGWLRGGWAASQPPFSVAAGFLPGRCRVEVPPQHARPLLALQAPEALLQGEQASVTVTVRAAADSIHGAVLLARALHVESQQEVGLLLLAGGADEPPLGPAPELAEGDQPPSASVPGAQPIGKSGGGRVLLGELAPSQQRQLVLLLDARYRGTVEVAAELQYSAAARGGKPEAGHCTASLSLPVQLPWRLGLQLLGPPATHTLLAAAPPSAAGTAGSSSEGGEGALSEQQRRLQSLSMQDGGAAAVAGPGAAALPGMGAEPGPGDARDLPLLLLRSLPPRLVLPAGQRCTLLVQLQSLAACQLDVLGVDLEAAEGATAAPAAPAVPAGVEPALAGPHAEPDTLNKSDVFTAAFSLLAGAGSSEGAAAAGTAGQPAELPSLGFLRLRWRRHQRRPPLLAAAAARGASQLSAAAAKAAVAGAAGGSSGGAAAVPPPAPACEVLVPLPLAACLPPLLTASVRFPPTVVAGQPAELHLHLHNASGTVQEVGVVVGDPHGFLLAGPKSTTVQLLPRAGSSVSWQAVPYHTGLLRLPEITASSAQHAQQVEVTRGCSVFVERPAEQQQAPAAAAGPLPVAAGVPSLL